MPASYLIQPRERFAALAWVVFVQALLALVLIRGLRVEISSSPELISHLVEIALPKPPPPVPPKVAKIVQKKISRAKSEAPRTVPKPIGGSPGSIPSSSTPAPTPVVPVHPSQSSSGGGSSTGAATGTGEGGGTGGEGTGEGDVGGTDLVQIAGEILSSDYPKDLRERGIGGRVEILFTVGADGRVKSCTVTRSSGVAELDQLTCRLITQRFRYRPSTDRFGHPIADEVEGEHDWVAGGG